MVVFVGVSVSVGEVILDARDPSTQVGVGVLVGVLQTERDRDKQTSGETERDRKTQSSQIFIMALITHSLKHTLSPSLSFSGNVFFFLSLLPV